MTSASFWPGRRVLVTGHTGFKGSWLTLWLLTLGAEVWGYALPAERGSALFLDLGLDQATENADWGNLRHRLGDVCDLESLSLYVEEAQPEVVFARLPSRWCVAATAIHWPPGPPMCRDRSTYWRH